MRSVPCSSCISGHSLLSHSDSIVQAINASSVQGIGICLLLTFCAVRAGNPGDWKATGALYVHNGAGGKGGYRPSQSQVKKAVVTGPEPEGRPTERRREGQKFAKGS